MTDAKRVVGKHFDIIRYPINTEQSNKLLASNNAYTFVVSMDATKPSIKEAVERVFNVKVVSVNTMVRKGKKKIFRGRIGQRSDIKKAIVRLEAGNKIEIGMGV